MTPVEPRVAIFALNYPRVNFSTSDVEDWFAKGLEIHFFTNEFEVDLLNEKFSIAITLGPKSIFKKIDKLKVPILSLE